MIPRERDKALMLVWLIRFGKDWTPSGQVMYSDLKDEVGRAERLRLIEFRYAPDEVRESVFEYRMTDEALKLLGIEEDA